MQRWGGILTASSRQRSPPTEGDLQRDARYLRNEFASGLQNLAVTEGDRTR